MKTSRELWDTIDRLHLVPTGEAERVKARWFRADRESADDPSQFARWLISNDYLSRYALSEISQGRADGLRLGNYLLLGPLESGPHAGSYSATDALGRKVLIDLVDAKLAENADVVRAFESAAERVMAVQHPHVGRVLDFGKAGGKLYLVRELDDGVTLAEILSKRDRVEADSAAKLFSQAFAGLQALHDKQVQGGDLSPSCLLLATLGKKARVVKIQRAGMPGALFQGGSADDVVRGLRPVARPEDDLFYLGQSFYKALTGKDSEATLAGGTAATPVRQLAPKVPDLLAETADQMLFPDLSARPRAASRVAKTLRIYLASEEEAREIRAEEEIGPPTEQAIPAIVVQEKEEVVEASFGKEGAAPKGRLMELWEEFGPNPREWMFLAGGAAGIVLLLLLIHLILGFSFVNIVCLMTGAALSYLAERMLVQRREPEV